MRATVVNEDEILVGSVVAQRYHVHEVIGQGLGGTVVAVEHVHTGRGLAMKIVRPRYASLEGIQHVFHTDARAAWTIRHPCAAEIVDAATLPDGALFLVTELLDGETLAARSGRERLSLASAVDVMMQLLSLLETVHARGILVRDLRPTNLFLVSRRGCRPLLKALDLGLAGLLPLDRIRDEVEAERLVGRSPASPAALLPHYLSPERARGEPFCEVASDLFVAAAIFYEILAGERPFKGDSWDAVVASVSHGHPLPLADLRPDLPEPLSALVSYALAADPRARPASAREMQDELRAIFESSRRGSSAPRMSSPSSHPQSRPDSGAPPSPSAYPPRTPHPRAFPSLAPANLAPYAPDGHRKQHRIERAEASASASFASLPTSRPPSGSYERQAHRAERVSDGAFADQTENNRNFAELEAAVFAATVRSDRTTDRPRTQRLPNTPNRADALDPTDENSADDAQRTVRPPRGESIDVDVDVADVEEPTTHGLDIDDALRAILASRGEDDETERRHLTPELIARLEAMARAPLPVPPSATPLQPPPRRRR